MNTREALTGAIMWLKLICEEADIDPEETCINVGAKKDGVVTKELAKISLATALEQYEAVLKEEEDAQISS